MRRTAMNTRNLLWIPCCTVILALLVQITVARLHKRNGYYYKQQPVGNLVQHVYYKQTLSGHDEASGPEHLEETQYGQSQNSNSNSYYTHPQTSASSSSLHEDPESNTALHGYSIGSGLRSIAQGSANQAYDAVVHQHAAANQAAFVAKNTLAQTATQAAATAQAALAGKEVLLQELLQQANEAQRALSREAEQLNAAKVSAKLARQTAQAANNHVKVLTAALNNAKSVAEQAEEAANEVSNQLASQSSMVGQAKSKMEQVEEQLKQAQIDYAATKEAATKAASSAATAQVNASKAAAHATIGLHESANQHKLENDGTYDDHVEPSGQGHSKDDDDIIGEHITTR